MASACRRLVGALLTSTCRVMRMAWPGKPSHQYSSNRRTRQSHSIMCCCKVADLALAGTWRWLDAALPFHDAKAGSGKLQKIYSSIDINAKLLQMLSAARRRDGGSRAGTPFPVEEDATDGSALDMAQLQGLLSDSGPVGDFDRAYTVVYLTLRWCRDRHLRTAPSRLIFVLQLHRCCSARTP